MAPSLPELLAGLNCVMADGELHTNTRQSGVGVIAGVTLNLAPEERLLARWVYTLEEFDEGLSPDEVRRGPYHQRRMAGRAKSPRLPAGLALIPFLLPVPLLEGGGGTEAAGVGDLPVPVTINRDSGTRDCHHAAGRPVRRARSGELGPGLIGVVISSKGVTEAFSGWPHDGQQLSPPTCGRDSAAIVQGSGR